MADTDAYSASGGWSGGSASALANNGVLGSYLQKIQTVNPTSGSLSVAQPTSTNQQSSSLSQVVNPSTSTIASVPTVASTTSTVDPTTAAATAAANATAQAVAPVSTLASGVSRAATTTTAAPVLSGGLAAGTVAPAATSNSLAPTAATDSSGVPADTVAAAYAGPAQAYAVGSDGNHYSVTYNPNTNAYMAADYSILINQTTDPTKKAQLVAQQNAANAAAASFTQQQATAIQARAQAVSSTAAQNAQNATARQSAIDTQNAAAAQLAADQATKFNLATQLQAPNTTNVDQANRNQLNQIISQYSSGLGGADSGAYGALGQSAMATQAAVNQVSHDTAYANAFNDNYKTFTDALTGQQTADANASGQKLNLDIQGVADAVTSLEQQGSQLSQAGQTALQTQLVPLKQLLSQYQLAVKQYGSSSPIVATIAQSILGGASSLAATVPAAGV